MGLSAKRGKPFRQYGAAGVSVADYEADPALMEMLRPYDARAREDAETVIGRLEGGPLAPENETPDIPSAVIQDTALIDLINDVQMHYSGAPVSAAVLSVTDANMVPGEIRKCDTAQIFRFSNTLYKLQMTGAQLKKFMEWSAGYYNTIQQGDNTDHQGDNPLQQEDSTLQQEDNTDQQEDNTAPQGDNTAPQGDITAPQGNTDISFNKDYPYYNYQMFAGVSYEINLSREPGSRIEHLTWPDGTPVREEDVFDIAVNSYCANSQLLLPGVIYEADELPVLLEMDVHGEIGSIRELIRDYILHVKGGVIRPACD